MTLHIMHLTTLQVWKNLFIIYVGTPHLLFWSIETVRNFLKEAHTLLSNSSITFSAVVNAEIFVVSYFNYLLILGLFVPA